MISLYNDRKPFFDTCHGFPRRVYNPDLRSARLYCQFSLDKMLTLQAGATVLGYIPVKPVCFIMADMWAQQIKGYSTSKKQELICKLERKDLSILISNFASNAVLRPI